MGCRRIGFQEKHYPFKSQIKKNLQQTMFLNRNGNFWRAKHLFIIEKPIASEKPVSLLLLLFSNLMQLHVGTVQWWELSQICSTGGAGAEGTVCAIASQQLRKPYVKYQPPISHTDIHLHSFLSKWLLFQKVMRSGMLYWECNH